MPPSRTVALDNPCLSGNLFFLLQNQGLRAPGFCESAVSKEREKHGEAVSAAWMGSEGGYSHQKLGDHPGTGSPSERPEATTSTDTLNVDLWPREL